MHRNLVPIVPLLFGALGACTADSGDEGILVVKAVAPGDKCTFTGIATEPFLADGSLELGNRYFIFPQMESRITALTGQEVQRTVIVQEADVDLAFTDTTLFTAAQLATMKTNGVTHFKSLLSVPLPPNGGIADGGFELIPTTVSDAILAARTDVKIGMDPFFETQVVATFRMKGVMSGESVQSQPFQFPVTLVNEGLVNNLGPCPATGTPRVGNPCNAGQDAVVDCCTKGGVAYCPAPTQ